MPERCWFNSGMEVALSGRERKQWGILFRAAVYAALVLLAACNRLPQYDLIIRNGRILDGTGAPEFQAEIAVAGDRIVAIGQLPPANARTVIDARGKFVAPGFIDLQNYSVQKLPSQREAKPLIQQGITSALLIPERAFAQDLWPVAAYLHQFDIFPPALNVGVLVSYHTLQTLAAQTRQDHSPANGRTGRVRILLDRALRDGAFGMYAGMAAIPPDSSNLAALTSAMRHLDTEEGLLMLRPRDLLHNFVESIREVDSLARAADRPVHVVGMQMVRAGALENPGVAAFLARCNRLRFHFPLDTAWQGVLARLVTPETLFDWREIMHTLRAVGGASRLNIRLFPSAPEFQGFTLWQFARTKNISPYRAFIEILKENGNIMSYRTARPDYFRRFLSSPQFVVSSGSGLDAQSMTGSAALPHFLRSAALDTQAVFIEKAVHLLTGAPARQIGLADRGILRKNACADIVIFDPEKLGARMAQDGMAPRPQGISTVIVNGTVVYENGKMTGARPGQVLRRRIPPKTLITSSL